MRLCVSVSFLLVTFLAVGAIGLPKSHLRANFDAVMNDSDIPGRLKIPPRSPKSSLVFSNGITETLADFTEEEPEQLRSVMPEVQEILGRFNLNKIPSVRNVVKDLLKSIYRSKEQHSDTLISKQASTCSTLCKRTPSFQ